MEGQAQGQSQSEDESQRVVLVHDVGRELRMSAVRWVLDGFFLKPGDMFTLLSVIHQIRHPLGYKIRLDSSMFGANQKAVDDEVATMKKEYEENLQLIEISKLYETQNVDFKIELVAGPIPKNAAIEASKKLNATWVILDRRMKRDKKYFLEKLSCGISTMKRNDDIVKIRGPKLPTSKTLSYNEMLPVDNKFSTRLPQNDDDLFSIEFESSTCTSSSSTRTSISDSISTGNNQDDKQINQLSTLTEAQGEELENSAGDLQTPSLPPEENVQSDRKKCTTCNSTRPTSTWQTRDFSYSELVDATNRFSSETLVYRGENEAVFYGILKCSKLNVIVKEQKDVKKCKSEVQALEKTRHPSVIMLLGTCLEQIPRLLVFEFACNGSLDQHLSHQNSRPNLTWAERMKIAVGVSKGLYHLHENNITHGDMRPKNIFLTHDFEPLIAGFGLARIGNESENSSNHFIIGTFGYLAPEYTERGKATPKTDVYAFGIVLLELLTGRSPTDTRLKGQSLLKWVIFLVKEGKFSELVDPGIDCDNNQFISIVQMTLNCLCKDPRIRLSMEEVVFTLDYIKDEQIGSEGRREDEIEEVNGNMESVGGSQRAYDEEVNFNLSGMTPVPKQAKHFYQAAQI